MPAREEHFAAAGLNSACRRRGVRLAKIDAVIAQLRIALGLVLLTADADFGMPRKHVPLRVSSGWVNELKVDPMRRD